MTPQFPVPGMDPVATNPDAAPPMRAPPLLRRLACWVYEGMLLFGVVFIAGYLFGTLSQTRNAMDNRNPLQAFVFLIFGIYFTWFWSKGQTLAMKTWGIRLLDAHGKPPTQARAMLRYVLCWVWFLPPLALVGPLATKERHQASRPHPRLGRPMSRFALLWAIRTRSTT